MKKHPSVNTVSTPQSRIKDETKDKFDALLKEALNSKSKKDAHNQSTQKLISDVESFKSSIENLQSKTDLKCKKLANSIEIVEVDVHEGFQNDNFILNKFLNDTNQLNDVEAGNLNEGNEVTSLDRDEPDVVFIKPPVPRPRKCKKVASENYSSASSTGTYNIDSPAAVTRTSENSKPCDVQNDLLKTVRSTSDNSTNISTSKSDQSRVRAKSSDSPILITKTINAKSSGSQSSDNSENERVLAKSRSVPKINAKHSEKIDIELTDQIEYENEIKSKRKRKSIPKRRETLKDAVETVIENKSKIKFTYEKIIGITVHKTDRLKFNSLVIHPVVKIHIVDGETGKYVKKSDTNRPVVFYYENKDIVYITPVISEPYNLYEKRSLYPAWEETLTINEDINVLLTNNTIVFFEVMDFVSFSIANTQSNQKGSSRGWHKIAWAFLKPLGHNNSSNVDKKARLQLHYPGKCKKVPPHMCDIFHWWNNKKLIKYPASLHVTVKGIIPPEKVVETLRSKTPIHGEKASRVVFGEEVYSDQNFSVKSMSSTKIDENNIQDDGNQSVWSRSNYQMCKFPNKCVVELPGYDEGCLTLQFSHNGLYLACAVLIDNVQSIIVYLVKSYEEIRKYSGHQGLIYDISWSKDDQFIITASADCTACIWSFAENNFVEMLPHPSYVYVSQINSKSIIATGCYDEIIRIWSNANNEMSYNLFQELEGHKGYITSLVFNSKSTVLYSSDAVGAVIEWKYNSTNNIWNLKREIKLTDLRDTVINQILLLNRERRLLIHARDNALRILDLKTCCVLYWLQGSLNNRVKTMCSFSPCGNFILAGSENGLINVWNSDLGLIAASYTPYDAFSYQNLPIHCAQFHPHDNILAVSHYGHNLPILLILYDASLDGKSNVGLKMLQNDELYILQKGSKLKPLQNLKAAVRKIVTEDGNSEKRHDKIKFEDVIKKIDEIVSINRAPVSDSSRSSVNNIN